MSTQPAARRGRSGLSRSRPLQIAVVGVCVVLLVIAGFVFLRGGGGGSKKTKHVSKVVVGNVQLTIGNVNNANGGPPAQLSDAARAQIGGVLAQYVRSGLVDPVKTRKAVSGDVLQLFDLGAAAQAQGPDRAVLFDEGIPKLTGSFTPTLNPADLTALSDNNGNFVLVTAALNYQAAMPIEGGTLTEGRVGLFTLAPDAGTWKITAYQVNVSRTGAGLPTPSTTSAASSTTKAGKP